MTSHTTKRCALIFAGLMFAAPSALAQPNLPDNASANAHQKVLDNVDPAIMAEVERMKAEQKARSDESRNNFASTSQGNGEVSLFVPPSIPVIVVVETDDGELAATEF